MIDCPLPIGRYDRIVMGHGGGGRLTRDLVRDLFLPAFDHPVLAALEDQAVLTPPPGQLALTTDAFVVRPAFFPGGDIGRLAVCGTVNDLACGGAEPLYLTAAFVIEEGFAFADLARIVASMRAACAEASVAIVAGDTKVVERGKADGLYISTSGAGVVPAGRSLSIHSVRAGDRVLVSGPIGDHGVAVMSVRDNIGFECDVQSDCAPLGGLARALLAAVPETRCMRDPTRGGLATALNEIAAASRCSILLDERSIPVREGVRAACEILGLDPLYVACEGRLIAIVPELSADRALDALRAHPLGGSAASIGNISGDTPPFVAIRTAIGGERLLPLLSGEQLPRIC